MKLILGFLVHHSFQRVSNIEPEDKVELEEVKSIEEKLEDERVAWQYFGPGWTRVLDQIKREKDQRHHELLVIDRRKEKLSEWKKRLEQRESNLTARETRILESEPFQAAARKLQNLKIGIEEVLPWVQTINEVAQMQKMDLRASALYVNQEIKLNREFGGILRQIEIARGQLKVLNTICAQKERGLSILTELQNKGVSTDAIYGFSKILDLERMGKEWNPLTDNGQKVGQNYSMNMGQNLGQNSGQNQPRTSPEYWYQQSRSSR